MKQQIDPKVLVAVIVAGVLLLAFVGYRVWSSPSVTPAPEVASAASGTNTGTTAGTMADGGAIRGSGNRGGGGPTAADLQKRDAYNAANPGAGGSSR